MRLLSKVHWRPSPNLLLAVASLGAGIAAFVLARQYLQERVTTLEQQVSGRLQTRPVVVAAREIAIGQIVEASQLAVRQMPRSYLRSDVLTPEQAGMLVGRRLLHAVAAGDALVDADVAAAETQALARQLPPGLRAVTVVVDEVSAQAGLLRAGDLIDLYHSRQSGEAAAQLHLLLQSVPVLATGKRTVRTQSQGATEPPDFSTITLQLTPDDAARVLLAQRTGALTAVLRGADDLQTSTLSVLDSRQLFAAIPHTRTAAPAAATAPAALQVIAGGGASVRNIQQVLTELPSSASTQKQGALR
jgi:pilus assembly protein CpaB